MLTIKQYIRIGEYLMKYDRLLVKRESLVLDDAKSLDGEMHRLYFDYADIRHLFWSFEQAREIHRKYHKRLLLL